MQMKLSIDFDKVAYNRIDAALAAIETNVRGSAINSGLRAIGADIKTKTIAVLPKPGYERHTRTSGQPYRDKDPVDFKPLGQTIKTKLVDYGLIKVAVIGYEWPAGAHGWIVEAGHDMVVGGPKGRGGRVVGSVAPASYMTAVVVQRRSTFDSIMVSAAAKLLKT